MLGLARWRFAFSIAGLLAAALPLCAQQDSFRWMDFHSQPDQDIVVWVTRSLDSQKWSAIREVGVQYDAALVFTTQRTNPQAPANGDLFAVWSVNLTNHAVTPLLKGANLRMLDWMRFTEGGGVEPAILYDNCAECAADTYLTAFHYDLSQHVWAARWMRGGQAVPLRTGNPPAGLAWTEVNAALAEGNGREFLATWNHIDYGKHKPAEDYLYQYDLDQFSGLERMQQLRGAPAEAMKQRLCRGQDAVPGLAHGQDSPLCQQILKPRYERKPVTTPPADNHGQSAPPGPRH